MSDPYETIRKENERDYGMKARNWGSFLKSIYRERTHFIYELLQNTEDAYARLRRESPDSATLDRIIHFYLHPDRLEVRHCGVPFDEKDMRSICAVNESTKKDDINQIGKFGIGFKSVYTYTEAPEIHSGPYSFLIKDYVFPFPVEPKKRGDRETLIVIPFTLGEKDEIPADIAFSEIKEKLKNLESETLLFLEEINGLHWTICDNIGRTESGVYERRNTGNEVVEISSTHTQDESTSITYEIRGKKYRQLDYRNQHYLLPVRIGNSKDGPEYSKDVNGELVRQNVLFRYPDQYAKSPQLDFNLQRELRLNLYTLRDQGIHTWYYSKEKAQYEVFELVEEGSFEPKSSSFSYLLKKRSTLVGSILAEISIAFLLESEKRARKVDRPRIAVHFLTDREIDLGFFINAPFQTTAARNDIPLTQYNRQLVEALASLIADSLESFKVRGMLDAEFLSLMPICSSRLKSDNLFTPLFEIVKARLMKNPLIPTDGGGHIEAERGLLGRGADLRRLLSSKQLIDLGYGGKKWLDGRITETYLPEVREYLIQELGVREVRPEDLVSQRALEEVFLSKQSDAWMIDLYDFLLSHKSLSENKALDRPIIRLQDGKHVKPFSGNIISKKPAVFLPSGDVNLDSALPIVKGSLIQGAAKDFFRYLGLEKPDYAAYIEKTIIPEYQRAYTGELAENKRHILFILDTLDRMPAEGKKRILNLVSELRILRAHDLSVDVSPSSIRYVKCSDVYIGKPYSENSEIEEFFLGASGLFLLDRSYGFDSKAIIGLQALGCKNGIRYSVRTPDDEGFVAYVSRHGRHEKGINGFDPACNIIHLEQTLNRPTLRKAEIIWRIVVNRNLTSQLSGTILCSSKQDYSGSSTKKADSQLGKLLRATAWIPSRRDAAFHRPKDLKMQDIPDSLNPSDPRSLELARALGIGSMEKDDEELYAAERNAVSELTKRLPKGTECFGELMESVMKDFHEGKLNEAQVKDIAGKIKGTIEGMKQKEDDGVTEKRRHLDPIGAFQEGLKSKNRPVANRQVGGRSMAPDDDEIQLIDESFSKSLAERIEKTTLVASSKQVGVTTIEGGSSPREFLYDQYSGHCQVCNEYLDLGVSGTKCFYQIFRIAETRSENETSNMEYDILCLCPNCWSIMKHGNRDLSQILTTVERFKRQEIHDELVEERNGRFFIVDIKLGKDECQLYYSKVHMLKLSKTLDYLGKK